MTTRSPSNSEALCYKSYKPIIIILSLFGSALLNGLRVAMLQRSLHQKREGDREEERKK
jgi:hypothetical protein